MQMSGCQILWYEGPVWYMYEGPLHVNTNCMTYMYCSQLSRFTMHYRAILNRSAIWRFSDVTESIQQSKRKD